MLSKRNKQPGLLTQLIDVLLIELTNWRWSWRSMIVIGTLSPVLSMVALGVFARDSGKVSISYVLVGNVVLAIMFNIMSNIESHVSFMRFHGMLDYFATLPVRRIALIPSLVTAFLLISLPALAATLIIGSLLLGVPLHISPLVLLVVPICAMPLAGIGALIGAKARTPMEANSINFLVMFLLLSIGPVIVPPQKLPAVLLILGRVSPATYASSALRQVLLGPITGQLTIDIAVLLGVTVMVYWWVSKAIDWRQ